MWSYHHCIGSSIVCLLLVFSHQSSVEGKLGSWLWTGEQNDDGSALRSEGSLGTNGEDLPLWAIGRGTTPRLVPLDYSVQMMHKPEVDLIASYLRPDSVYLEYGSGGSTRNFASLVSDLTSIEHDCTWLQYLDETMKKSKKKYDNVKTICVSVEPGTKGWGTISGFEHGNYEQFKPFVDAIDTLGVRKFDAVLIDGRARLASALKVLPYLKNESVVFMHDFYTRVDIYGGVLKYYDEVARVLATLDSRDPRMGPIEEPQGLVVLKRKPGLAESSLPLGDEIIHREYSLVNWRQGMPDPLVSLKAYAKYYLGHKTHPQNWQRPHTPENLVDLVKSDVLRMALLYALLSLIFRNRQRLLRKLNVAKLKLKPNQDEGIRRVTINNGFVKGGLDRPGSNLMMGSRGSVVDTDAVARAAARRKFRIQRAASSPISH